MKIEYEYDLQTEIGVIKLGVLRKDSGETIVRTLGGNRTFTSTDEANRILVEENKKFVPLPSKEEIEARELAELIHDKVCHADHTDQCGWGYESWDRPEQLRTRKKYLDKANSILHDFSFTTAKRVIEGI